MQGSRGARECHYTRSVHWSSETRWPRTVQLWVGHWRTADHSALPTDRLRSAAANTRCLFHCLAPSPSFSCRPLTFLYVDFLLRYVAVSVCPSVCLLHSCIVSKQLNVSSDFFLSLVIIIIIIIPMTMFMVLSSWPQGHWESSLGSFDECRTAPSGRRPSDQATWLGL